LTIASLPALASRWAPQSNPPLREEPIAVPLVPLNQALLILVLPAYPLEYRCHPAVLPLPLRLIYISNVLPIPVVPHSVHLVLLLELLVLGFLGLEQLRLDVDDGLCSIVIHSIFS